MRKTVNAKIAGKSECCNGEVMNWFGNVTHVMLGGEMPAPTLICMECRKPTTKNQKLASEEEGGGN